MKITEQTARPIPTSYGGMLGARRCPHRLVGHVGGKEEELDRDEFLGALLGGVGEHAAPGEASQMMITLATPSTPESRPKPISAIEEATIPATMATAPSTVIQASESQESRRTLPASRS